MGWPWQSHYRTRDEVDKIRKTSDPIENIKELLIKHGTNEEMIKEIDTEIKATIADAANFAQESPEPSPEELFTDITINWRISDVYRNFNACPKSYNGRGHSF